MGVDKERKGGEKEKTETENRGGREKERGQGRTRETDRQTDRQTEIVHVHECTNCLNLLCSYSEMGNPVPLCAMHRTI